MRASIRYKDSRAIVDELLPGLSRTEAELVASLPDQFHLANIPYVEQEKQHWSGAAIAQMLALHHGQSPVEQIELAAKAGWELPGQLGHESFSENLMHVLLTEHSLLSAQYYPAGHIAPKIGDGIQSTDFIRTNLPLIASVDFVLFKAVVFARNAPAVVRIHFSTQQYPMPDEVAQKLDIAGHCMLLVGWDKEGFILHDPWPKSSAIKGRGGADIHIAYTELIEKFPIVNCSADMIMAVDRFEAFLPPTRVALYPGRDVEMDVVVRWPGIRSISLDRCFVQDIETEFIPMGNLIPSHESAEFDGAILRPGDKLRLTTLVNTGNSEGSFGIEARTRAVATIKEFPWVPDSKQLRFQISTSFENRLCVMSKDFFGSYGAAD
ncbi:MAG: hypothetical protein ACRDRS_18760 [Pseudonocardiaceae bacterium]